MGHQNEREGLLEELEEQPLVSRRHRPVAEVKLPKAPPDRSAPVRQLGAAARVRVWADLRELLFDGGTFTVLRRVWSAPPIGGIAERMPPDVAEVLERWVMLVEATDVYRLLDAVHDALDPARRLRFVANVNALLDHADAGYRFMLRRLVPTASRSDSAAIERALAACKSAGWSEVEANLEGSLDHLGEKPEPNVHDAIRFATAAAQGAASVVTGTTYVDLVDALHDLQRRGLVGPSLRAAYEGLDAYSSPSARRTSSEEARLVVLTCAALVAHLASRP